MELKSAIMLLTMCVGVFADVYMQNPRGSNNRLNGAGRDRRNAQRLFDSENNARGGYNAGGLEYHVGSELSVEWTNQHSCSGPNNNCELVLQYMCDDKIRNGENERTIPFPAEQTHGCDKNDCDTDLEYGMNEDYNHYLHCYIRERNKGIFTADQDMHHRYTARFTRQDRNGQRHGYECPEERDYYPYWGASPWKDIVVMTSNTSRCAYYTKHSANVAPRYHCVVDLEKLGPGRHFEHFFRRNPVPITEQACKDYENEVELKRNGEKVIITGKWEKIEPHGISAPVCIVAPRSRDNHNGNGPGGFPNTYNWTIPNDVHDKCILRLRYNISTGDYPWETDAKSNGVNRNNKPCKACAIGVGSQVGIDDKFETEDRNYILTGNPEILPLKIGDVIKDKFELKLAINTAQFGRTFQDRSHVFSITEHPAEIPADTKIYNYNVRGKRGNIVQTYPATEYDFVPNRLMMKRGDALHIQWTGSNTNPGNNAGQGRAGTDRSNIVQLTSQRYDGSTKSDVKGGHWANSYPAHLDESNLLGLSEEDRRSLAFSGMAAPIHDDVSQMDDASAYYNLGVRVINQPGDFRFMSSRNNAFTNRGQKGFINVKSASAGDEMKTQFARNDAEDRFLHELDSLDTL